MNRIACAVAGGIALAANVAIARPEKWVFAKNSFAEDAEVAYVSNVVARAKASGMTGLCLISGAGYTSWNARKTDRDLPTLEYIGNTCGLESWDKWDPKRKDRFNAIRAYCDSIGFDIVPLLWSPGYFSMRYENPSWVAVFPVKDVACVASGGRIVCAGRKMDVRIDTKGVWNNGVLELDIDKIHASGSPRAAGGSIRFKARPYTRYRLSLKFATKGFTGTGYEPSWPTISFYVKDGICSGGVGRRKMEADQGWVEHSKEINSLHHTDVAVDFGSFTDRPRGKLYVKDVVLEECGIDQPVKREGCPFVVRDAETGKVYREGIDYAGVPYMKALAWPSKSEPIAFDVVPGGAIRDGARLLVSAYEPPRAMVRQFSVCPSVPGLGDFMKKAADNVYAATGSLKWLLSLDEIRNECQCELCLKRKEDIAHKMGAHITELVDAILDRYPAADLYAWCDMLNPYDNPKQKHYYNCLTTWQGIWDLIPGPDRLKMVYWGEKPKPDEVDFFAKRGYRGIAAGYYDYDPELKEPAKWVEAMNGRPDAFDGWMYTTWEQKHDQLEDFAKIMNDGWKMRKPEKWVFWNRHLDTPELSAAFSNVVSRAAALGFGKVCVSAGLDYYSCMPDRAKASVLASLKHVRDCGMGITVDVWSLGYGAMLNYGLEFIEGAPVRDVTYVVDKSGEKATFVPAPTDRPHVPNGGFERYSKKRGFADFTFIDGDRGDNAWIRQDTSVKRSGDASLVCEMGKGMTRISQRISPMPNRHYRLTAHVRWEGFDPKRAPIRLFVQRERGNGKTTLVAKSAQAAASSDWVKLETEFNSVEFGDLRAWLGVWDSGQTGRFWVDDMSVEEVAPRCVLHAYGSPRSVQRRSDGRLFVEGRDYSLPSLSWPIFKDGDGPVEIAVLNRRQIRPGDELAVTYYTPSTSGDGNDRQVSICPSDPALYKVLAASAKTIDDLIRPEEWLLSFDEWRNGNVCAACQARGTTLPAMIADCAARCSGIIRGLNPNAKVWIWSDMFCPYENALQDYYSVRGRCDGGLKHLPVSIGAGCWGNAKKAKESMSLFERAGHRTFAAAYYDEDDSFAGTGLWIEALKSCHNDSALCYTTWQFDYRNLEKWSRFVDEAFK